MPDASTFDRIWDVLHAKLLEYTSIYTVQNAVYIDA
jgi:hypothetical protein